MDIKSEETFDLSALTEKQKSYLRNVKQVHCVEFDNKLVSIEEYLKLMEAYDAQGQVTAILGVNTPISYYDTPHFNFDTKLTRVFPVNFKIEITTTSYKHDEIELFLGTNKVLQYYNGFVYQVNETGKHVPIFHVQYRSSYDEVYKECAQYLREYMEKYPRL